MYLVFIVLLAVAVAVAHRRLGCWQDPRPADIASCRPQNPWRDARSWMKKEITYAAFQAMSPLEKESLRQLVVLARDGPPELYRALAVDKRPYVLVIAANNGGYVYSALSGDDVPEPEQIADLTEWYDCPVFLFRRAEMLS